MSTTKMHSSLFRNKNYVLLLSAQSISNIGDWLHLLALFALVALKWDGSPFMMTGIMLSLTIPGILFGSIAGVIADKFERKTLMVSADIFRAVIVLGIAFSTTLWEIYLSLIFLSLCSNLFSPAKSGKLKEIVSDDQIQTAISYSEMINNSAKIAGPALSGLLVAALGIQSAFYCDAASFLLSAGLLNFIVKRPDNFTIAHPNNLAPSARQNWIRDITDGFRLMKTIPAFLAGLIILCAVFMILQISDSQAMILIREVPGKPIHLAGYSIAASGAGMLIASALLSRKKLRSQFLTLSISPIVIGVVLLLAGLFIHFPPILLMFIYPVLFFFAGSAFAFAVIPFEVMSQRNTPAAYTGRVFGTINSLSTLSIIIGLLAGGVLTELKGPAITYIISGTLLITIGVIVLLYRKQIEGRENHGTESIEGTL